MKKGLLTFLTILTLGMTAMPLSARDTLTVANGIVLFPSTSTLYRIKTSEVGSMDMKILTMENNLAVGDSLPCPGTPTVTDIDGNTYNTVKIGNQCWMRENLRVTHYADGTDIPAGGSNTSYTVPYYYDYSSSSIPLVQRGYLYNWPAAMHGAASSNSNPSNVQGICPTGWHLPSNAECVQLTDYASSQSEYTCGGNSSNIAKALASTEGWNNSEYDCTVGNNQAANNATGICGHACGQQHGQPRPVRLHLELHQQWHRAGVRAAAEPQPDQPSNFGDGQGHQVVDAVCEGLTVKGWRI